jgi:hypothetical protein
MSLELSVQGGIATKQFEFGIAGGVEHNSIRDLLKRIHGNKTRSKWLKPFVG